MARGDRESAVRLPVPRLERAHHRRVLRPQRQRAHSRRREPHRGDRQQLRVDEFQLRPDAPLLARGEGARRLRRDPRGRRGEPPPLLGPRLRARAALQPHHPAALGRPRPEDAGRVGGARLRPPLRPSARGHVAARDGRRPAGARGARGGRDRVHDPRAAPGEPRAPHRRGGLARGRGGVDRSDDAVRDPPAVRKADRGFLLRRSDLARGRLRAAADDGGALRRAPRRRVRPGRPSPARPHRDRRRDLRAPPPPRRHGARVRAAHARRPPARDPHQLRRVPGAASPDPRGAHRRAHVLELRARGRALAERLRVSLRPPSRRDAGLARAAARGARRPARCARAALGGAGAALPEGPVARAERLRRGAPRPLHAAGVSILRGARAPAARRPRDDRGARASRDAAARPADVHELRLVLRRRRRHRGRAR